MFWRQVLRFAVLNVPPWLEPIVMASWSAFFLLWGPARRGVMRNLARDQAGLVRASSTSFAATASSGITHGRSPTTFASRSCARFRTGSSPAGSTFRRCRRGGGAILLTAHMGSYDLGAHFSRRHRRRRIVMVRAPEDRSAKRALLNRTRAAEGPAHRIQHAVDRPRHRPARRHPRGQHRGHPG